MYDNGSIYDPSSITQKLDADNIANFLNKFNDITNTPKRKKLLPNKYIVKDISGNHTINFQLSGDKGARNLLITSIANKIKQLIKKFKNEQESTSKKDYFSDFRDNDKLIDFFLIDTKKNEDQHTEHITEYFRILDENLKDNEKEELKRKDRREFREQKGKDISEYNTRKEQKRILYKYGKYFNTEQDIESLDENSFYDNIKGDKELIKQIITYYNIYTILNEIITPKGTFINGASNKDNKKQRFYSESSNSMDEKLMKINKIDINNVMKNLKWIKI